MEASGRWIPYCGEAPGPETTGDPRFCTRWTLLGAPALGVGDEDAAHGLRSLRWSSASWSSASPGR